MHAIVNHVPGSAFVPDTRSLQRVAAAIGVSLLLHALLLAVYRQPPPAAVPATPAPLTVRLQAAAPPAPPLPVPAPQALPRQPKAAAPVKRSRPVIAVPAASRPSTEETYSVAPPPAAPTQDDAPPSTAPAPAPHFDMAAARNTARKVAKEPDPARVGTALERLPPKPLETESKLARAIGAAKRGNCKDGIPGGLLAPIYLMLEKKDSGCKW
jgi:hypothetical protein